MPLYDARHLYGRAARGAVATPGLGFLGNPLFVAVLAVLAVGIIAAAVLGLRLEPRRRAGRKPKPKPGQCFVSRRLAVRASLYSLLAVSVLLFVHFHGTRERARREAGLGRVAVDFRPGAHAAHADEARDFLGMGAPPDSGEQRGAAPAVGLGEGAPPAGEPRPSFRDALGAPGSNLSRAQAEGGATIRTRDGIVLSSGGPPPPAARPAADPRTVFAGAGGAAGGGAAGAAWRPAPSGPPVAPGDVGLVGN